MQARDKRRHSMSVCHLLAGKEPSMRSPPMRAPVYDKGTTRLSCLVLFFFFFFLTHSVQTTSPAARTTCPSTVCTKPVASWLGCDQRSLAKSNTYTFRLGTESWMSPYLSPLAVSYVQPNHAAAACFPRMCVGVKLTKRMGKWVH